VPLGEYRARYAALLTLARGEGVVACRDGSPLGLLGLFSDGARSTAQPLTAQPQTLRCLSVGFCSLMQGLSQRLNLTDLSA
jgi:hypothetical protein